MANNEEGVRAVKRALEQLSAAYSNRDADAATSSDLYSPRDATDQEVVVYDVAPPTQIVGRNMLIKRCAEFFESSAGSDYYFSSNWSDTHIAADENLAFFRGIWNMKFQIKGQRIELSMRHTLVLKKIDGKFLIVHEHASIPDRGLDYGAGLAS